MRIDGRQFEEDDEFVDEDEFEGTRTMQPSFTEILSQPLSVPTPITGDEKELDKEDKEENEEIDKGEGDNADEIEFVDAETVEDENQEETENVIMEQTRAISTGTVPSNFIGIVTDLPELPHSDTNLGDTEPANGQKQARPDNGGYMYGIGFGGLVRIFL